MSDDTGLEYIDLGLNEVDASDGSFTMVPPGDYVFQVEKVTGGQAKSGKPKMTLNIKVMEALDAENAKFEGEMIVQSFSLSREKDFPRRRVKSLLEACGVEIDSKGGFHPAELLDTQFVATIKHEEYTETNAVTQAKVVRESMRIFRERSIDTLEDGDEAGSNGANGSAKAAAKEPEPAPEEKKPASGRGRGRRRAAPSR